jgi:hypothetical protein
MVTVAVPAGLRGSAGGAVYGMAVHPYHPYSIRPSMVTFTGINSYCEDATRTSSHWTRKYTAVCRIQYGVQHYTLHKELQLTFRLRRSCQWYKKGKLRALTLPGQFGQDDEIEMREVDESLPAEADELIDAADPGHWWNTVQVIEFTRKSDTVLDVCDTFLLNKWSSKYAY